MSKKETVKKVISIVSNVLMYVFLALCLFMVVVSVAAKKDPNRGKYSDGAVTVFGHQMLFVKSDSMEKNEYFDAEDYKIKDIPVKSMVFVEVCPDNEAEFNEWCDELEIGDVLTFRYYYTSQVTITHRIKDIEEQETGGYKITLEGDNRSSPDSVGEQILYTDRQFNDDNYNYVIGKVVGQSYLLGLLIYASKQPLGIVLLIILPCVIIIVLEVIRIVSTLNAEKAEKVKVAQQAQEDEIEKLKQQLAQLQSGLAAVTSEPQENAPPEQGTAPPEETSKESTQEAETPVVEQEEISTEEQTVCEPKESVTESYVEETAIAPVEEVSTEEVIESEETPVETADDVPTVEEPTSSKEEIVAEVPETKPQQKTGNTNGNKQYHNNHNNNRNHNGKGKGKYYKNNHNRNGNRNGSHNSQK